MDIKLSVEKELRVERQRNLQTLNSQAEIAQDLSEREIQEITQGQQLSDLEIQILELKLGGI